MRSRIGGVSAGRKAPTNGAWINGVSSSKGAAKATGIRFEIPMDLPRTDLLLSAVTCWPPLQWGQSFSFLPFSWDGFDCFIAQQLLARPSCFVSLDACEHGHSQIASKTAGMRRIRMMTGACVT